MADAKAAQAERVRDLTGQLKGIGQQEMPGILFQEISPGREPVVIYSVEDGRPVPVPAYMLGAVMTKTLEDGRFMFVSDAKDAPEYKLGDVKCFLNPDSPMRGMVEAVGLGAMTCRKATLSSEHSRRIHGQHRHKQEWAAVKEYIEDQKEAKREARQDEQLTATLAIAGRAPEQRVHAVVIDNPKGECDICGKKGFKRIKAHKSMAHR